MDETKRGKKKEVNRSINLAASIIKKKSVAGLENDGLYFGFWLPCDVEYDDGSVKIVPTMTVVKPNGKNFFAQDPEKWHFYSKGTPKRISDGALNLLLEGDEGTIDGSQLFNDILTNYKEHIDLNESGNYEYMALFDICSYFLQLFDVAPQVHIQGFKLCGKTKLITLSSLMSFNGTLMTSFTLATVFRYVDDASPTLYIDEADKLLKSTKEGIEDVIAMFNSGYKRGARIPRCDKNNDVQWFDVFGSKVYGSINNIPSDFASRCHKIIMIRALGESKSAEKRVEEKDPMYVRIRSELYMFALQNWEEVQEIYNTLPNPEGLKHRDWEIWKPILTIAKFISEDIYYSMIDFSQESVKAKQKEEDTSDSWDVLMIQALGILVNENKYYGLSDIKAIMTDQSDDMSSPSNKWIGSALRKYGLQEFRRVIGKTQVLLSPQVIINLAGRNGIKLDENCQSLCAINKKEESVQP